MSFVTESATRRATPGSNARINLLYKDNPELGEDCKVESVSCVLKGISKSRVTLSDGGEVQKHDSETVIFETKGFQRYDDWKHDDIYSMGFDMSWPRDPMLEAFTELDSPDHPKPQNLPPSGHYGPGNSIEYFFEITLTASNGKDSLMRKLIRPVEFTPTYEPQAMEQERSTNTVKVYDPIATEPSNVKPLELELDYPAVVAIRTPFKLILNSGSMPDMGVFLRSWTLLLLEKTWATSHHGYHEKSTVVHNLGSEIHENSFGTRSLLKSKAVMEFAHHIIGDDCAPSFATSNLSRTYQFRLNLCIQSGDDTVQKVKFTTEEITVLSQETGSQACARQYEESYDPDWDGPRVLLDGRLVSPKYYRLFGPA